MTKEEIVKALRVCGTRFDCIGCTLQRVNACTNYLKCCAADLIKEQATEIEMLKAENLAIREPRVEAENE